MFYFENRLDSLCISCVWHPVWLLSALQIISCSAQSVCFGLALVNLRSSLQPTYKWKFFSQHTRSVYVRPRESLHWDSEYMLYTSEERDVAGKVQNKVDRATRTSVVTPASGSWSGEMIQMRCRLWRTPPDTLHLGDKVAMSELEGVKVWGRRRGGATDGEKSLSVPAKRSVKWGQELRSR